MDTAGGNALPYPFELADSEWVNIGGSYTSLEEADRQHIAELVTGYLFWRQPEDNVCPLSDALDHFDAITAAVQNLANILAPNADDVRNFALSEILERVPNELRRATGWQIDRCGSAHVSAILWAIAEAAQRAKQDIAASDQAGFRRHSAWRDFIWGLADWAESGGLTISAAKSKSAAKPGSRRSWPSPFVQFVKRLQNQLVPRWLEDSQLEFNSTDDAISTAIAGVLTARRRKLSPSRDSR